MPSATSANFTGRARHHIVALLGWWSGVLTLRFLTEFAGVNRLKLHIPLAEMRIVTEFSCRGGRIDRLGGSHPIGGHGEGEAVAIRTARTRAGRLDGLKRVHGGNATVANKGLQRPRALCCSFLLYPNHPTAAKRIHPTPRTSKAHCRHPPAASSRNRNW